MKQLILTIAVLGLLTGVSFAQRGRMAMGGNPGMTHQMGPISHSNIGTPRYMPNAIQPSARQMPPIVHRTAESPVGGTTGAVTSGNPATTVGNSQRTVAPPDAAVGPNVSQRKLQN